MYHFDHSSLLRSLLLAPAFALVACASSPTPPPQPAAPPAQAFQQAAGGVTEQQANPDDGVVFVEKEHKDPTLTHDTPATPVKADVQANHPKY